jgi:hypothetical protein
MEEVVGGDFRGEKIMESMAVALQSSGETPETWASACQFFGHSHVPKTRVRSKKRKLRLKRVVLWLPVALFVFFLGVPGAFGGQNQKGSWSDLKGLRSGQGIEVIETSMKRHGGEFVTFTDEALTLKEGGADVSIKRESVVRVSTSSAPRRGEHAVIGLVIGAAIGAAVGAASGSSHGFLGGSDRGIAALVGIAIGGPSGALVGALIPAHTTVYRVDPGALHQSMSP